LTHFRRSFNNDELNPYIGFTDLMINFVLVLVFFLSATSMLGRIGWDEVRYRDIQDEVRKSIQRNLRDFMFDEHPLESHNGNPVPLSRYRNDPPGAQRWVIYGDQLFFPDSDRLTPYGKRKLKKLAEVLRKHHSEKERVYPVNKEWLNHTWRRIRVEGHTRPTKLGESEDWYLSAARAAAVANMLSAHGIPPWFIAVAARGGQTPFTKNLPRDDSRHERVEIILEYAAPRQASSGSP
jgi:chemotaxis protein MotB